MPLAGSTEPIEDPQLGPTFGAAVVGMLLAMVQAGSVLVFARESGDGPFRNGVHNCTGLNTSSMPDSGVSIQHQPTPVSRPPAMSSEAELGVTSTAAQLTAANPTVEPAVLSPAAPSPVEGLGVKSAVANTAVEPAVVSPAVESPIPSLAVQSPVSSVAVESPAGSLAILSRKSSLTVTSPVVDPTVQPQQTARLWSPKQEASSE